MIYLKYQLPKRYISLTDVYTDTDIRYRIPLNKFIYNSSKPLNKAVLNGMRLSVLQNVKAYDGNTYAYVLQLSSGVFAYSSYLGIIEQDLYIPIDSWLESIGLGDLLAKVKQSATDCSQLSPALIELVKRLKIEYLYQPILISRIVVDKLLAILNNSTLKQQLTQYGLSDLKSYITQDGSILLVLSDPDRTTTRVVCKPTDDTEIDYTRIGLWYKSILLRLKQINLYDFRGLAEQYLTVASIGSIDLQTVSFELSEKLLDTTLDVSDTSCIVNSWLYPLLSSENDQIDIPTAISQAGRSIWVLLTNLRAYLQTYFDNQTDSNGIADNEWLAIFADTRKLKNRSATYVVDYIYAYDLNNQTDVVADQKIVLDPILEQAITDNGLTYTISYDTDTGQIVIKLRNAETNDYTGMNRYILTITGYQIDKRNRRIVLTGLLFDRNGDGQILGISRWQNFSLIKPEALEKQTDKGYYIQLPLVFDIVSVGSNSWYFRLNEFTFQYDTDGETLIGFKIDSSQFCDQLLPYHDIRTVYTSCCKQIVLYSEFIGYILDAIADSGNRYSFVRITGDKLLLGVIPNYIEPVYESTVLQDDSLMSDFASRILNIGYLLSFNNAASFVTLDPLDLIATKSFVVLNSLQNSDSRAYPYIPYDLFVSDKLTLVADILPRITDPTTRSNLLQERSLLDRIFLNKFNYPSITLKKDTSKLIGFNSVDNLLAQYPQLSNLQVAVTLQIDETTDTVYLLLKDCQDVRQMDLVLGSIKLDYLISTADNLVFKVNYLNPDCPRYDNSESIVLNQGELLEMLADPETTTFVENLITQAQQSLSINKVQLESISISDIIDKLNQLAEQYGIDSTQIDYSDLIIQLQQLMSIQNSAELVSQRFASILNQQQIYGYPLLFKIVSVYELALAYAYFLEQLNESNTSEAFTTAVTDIRIPRSQAICFEKYWVDDARTVDDYLLRFLNSSSFIEFYMNLNTQQFASLTKQIAIIFSDSLSASIIDNLRFTINDIPISFASATSSHQFLPVYEYNRYAYQQQTDLITSLTQSNNIKIRIQHNPLINTIIDLKGWIAIVGR